jgi:hypothetical protein
VNLLLIISVLSKAMLGFARNDSVDSQMKTGALLAWTAALALHVNVGFCSDSATSGHSAPVRIYAVNQRVADLPAYEDLSTPEAAYVSLLRAWVAEGDAAFARLSISEWAKGMPSGPAKPMPAKEAAMWLDAEVLEIRVAHETNAVVFARLGPGVKQPIDLRWLRPEKGRWLNAGNVRTDTLEEGRLVFDRDCAAKEAQAMLTSRPPVANPQEYLRPFVEFLHREAVDPQRFLLDALKRHRLVILGEVHHRPRYWDFYSSLVRSESFAEQVGVIFLEMHSNDQALVERFLAASHYDPQPVVEMLRNVDLGIVGWPDVPVLQLFKAVWETNQRLPPGQRLRVVLVDSPMPWNEIHQREDWQRYASVDRNERMADNLARDLGEHSADPRHALFIVGYLHTMVKTTFAGEPFKSTGWHLCQRLGETNVIAIFPHSPVMANMGGVNGRIALGLFETAFAALNNLPMAFPLDHGPFGKQVFDASLDVPTTDPFCRGFHAYLYLGPLEDEVFSPLIPGFYTEDCVREADRRYRIVTGKGLVEGEGLKRLDAASVVELLSRDWGQPRRDWSARQLGPIRAWELGSDWKKKVPEDEKPAIGR